MKKNWYLFVPAILILIPALMIGFYVVNFGYAFNDAWQATRHFGTSGTRYSIGYSDDHFSHITAGMDGRQVFESLGVPFEGQGGTEWKYSLPKGLSPYYHERTVIFERDKNNVPRVKKLVNRFHVP